MYATRLEMAADWLWSHRMGRRKLGEPVVDPFCQQPEDVTSPVNAEIAKVIRAVDVYDDVRDILRVDTRRANEVAYKLYKTFHPEAQIVPDAVLKEVEGAIKIMLHHIRVTGDAPWDLPSKEKD